MIYYAVDLKGKCVLTDYKKIQPNGRRKRVQASTLILTNITRQSTVS